MIREILLLFRYISLSKSRRSKEINKPIFNLLIYIAIASGFGIPTGILIWSILKKLLMSSSSLGPNTVSLIGDVFVSLSFTSVSLLFVLSYIPTIIFNLYNSHDLSFLLSLPIRRSSLFIFKALDSLVYSVPIMGSIFPISIAYSIVIGKGFLLGLSGAILYTIFLILLSLFFSIFLSRLLSRTYAKLLSNLISLFTIMFYIVVLNFLRPDTTTLEGIKRFVLNNYTYLFGSSSYYIPTRWLIMSLRGEPLGYFIIITISLVISLFLYLLSNRVIFEFNFHNRGKTLNLSYRGFPFPILKKDIKLLLRDPQSMYIILYSIIFPLVVSVANKSYTYGPVIMSLISSFYCAYISVSLLISEHKVWPLPKSLPLKPEDILLWKILIPFSLYSVLYAILMLIFVLLFKVTPFIYITLPMMSIVFLYSSVFGIKLFLKNPKRTTLYKNVFTPGEIFILEIVTIGLALGIMVPISLYIRETPWKPEILRWIFGIIIPTGVTLITVTLSVKTIRDVISVIKNWE